MLGSRMFWVIVAGFLIGVLVRSLVPVTAAYACFALLLACTTLFFGVLDRKQMQRSIVLATALASGAAGIVRMDAAVLTGDPHLTDALGSYVTIIGTVVAEPDVRESGVRITIDAHALRIGTTTTPVHARVLVQVPPHASVKYGDEVQTLGTLGLPQTFDTDNGRSFDYPDYLAASGIAYTLSFASVKSDGTNSGNPLVASAIDLKEAYLRGLDAVLPEPEAGLGGGITVGDKRSIGPALSADFQKVSLVQIVVLSGYNITVVANFAAALLARASRYVQFGAGAFIVLFFILISGGASSAVRAGLMALLAMYARHAGRSYDSLRALAVVAFAMVAWNPFTLAFDPGFQLSALAMLGLTLFTPTFDSYLQWIPSKLALREIIATTLATQLAVLPLMLYQDGELSLLALPANVLAMLPVPLSMLASCIAAVAGMLFGSYATPVALPAYILLSYIIAVAHVLASFPFASISIGAFSAWRMFAAYAALFGGFWYMQKRRSGEGKNPSAAPMRS